MQQLSFEPLTPTAFLRRSAAVFGDRPAVVDGILRFTYAEFLWRAERMAGALRTLGVQPGDRVAILAPNTHSLLLAHYGVPLAGAVLVALNVRLTPADLAFVVQHSGARVLLHDGDFSDGAREIARLAGGRLRLLQAGGEDDEMEALLVRADPLREPVAEERGLLALNYTSGTTARPKGVMYHHRGAYLQALAMVQALQLSGEARYLWTLPMFHCNGWCFTWAVTAAGGTHLCLRKLEPGRIWEHLREDGVTHLCAAPTVLTLLFWHPAAAAGPLPRRVRIATGGAAPTAALLERAATLGMDVIHLYGLTETFGPAVVCEWREEWSALSIPEQAAIKARQGVGNLVSEAVRVLDASGGDVPRDGRTLGEIAVRGNNVMLGYYQDDPATARAAPDGFFRTGDLGVHHPDGYVELKDRAKDIIISGGENISSLEVEGAIAAHPAVLEAAVVAAPDETWGEVPIAFVTLKPGAALTAEELIAHARARLAHFKAPKHVVFAELPKNATGKVQKFVLRDRARAIPCASRGSR